MNLNKQIIKKKFITFFNRNMKYKHFIIFNKITKFDNKMNVRAIKKTLTLLILIKCNKYY